MTSLNREYEKHERDLETLSSQYQDEHRSHRSLSYAIRSMDADLITMMLDRLRRGIYDEALGLDR